METTYPGFYYVCVEFDPQNGSSTTHCAQDGVPPLANETPASKFDTTAPSAADADGQWSEGSFEGEPRHQTATMSGFYFHQHSEP